jgi:hypothetical protein
MPDPPKRKRKPKRKDGKKDEKPEPLTWPQIIAKLQVKGLPIESIRIMTRYQVVSVLYEIMDEVDFRIALAGGMEEEEEEPEQLTAQDLLGYGWRERMRQAQEAQQAQQNY